MIAPIAGNLVIRLSITLGLGALMRGAGAVIFAGVPSGISLPISVDRITIGGVPIATDKLVAAIVAAFCIAFVGVFYRHSRTGLALQAIADVFVKLELQASQPETGLLDVASGERRGRLEGRDMVEGMLPSGATPTIGRLGWEAVIRH